MAETPSPSSPAGQRRSVRDWLASDKPLPRIVRNLLWLASGKGVGAVLSLLYLGIATRVLGVAQFGHFALILSMGTAIGSFAQFDCWQVVMRFGAAHLHADRQEALGRLIGACRVFDLVGIGIGTAIAGGTALLLSGRAGWDAETTRTAFLYTVAVLCAVRSTPMGVLRLHNRFDLSTYVETVVPVARLVGTLAALALHPSVAGFLAAWAASEMLASLAFWLFAWRVDPDALALRHSLAFRRTVRAEKGLLAFLGVTNFSTTLYGITSQAPVLMLGGFVSATAAGLFRLAFQLSQALSKVASLLSRSTYAELNHVHASGGRAALVKLLAKTNRITLIAGLALIVVIALLGKPVLWVIAGPDYAGSYPILLLLGVAGAINFFGIGYEPALLAVTNGLIVLRLRILLGVVLLGLLGLLLPLWGGMGAGTAMIGVALLRYTLFRLATRKYVHRPAE